MEACPPLEMCGFTYYPGIASGYSGFTDYHAMHSDLNDWLLKEQDDLQYWLAGFGSGFVQAVTRFCREAEPTGSTRHLIIDSGDAKIIMSIDWLQRLQLSGVDNGPPSTMNLLHALDGMCRKLEEDGPIRKEYWPRPGEVSAPTLDGRKLRAEKIREARQRGLDLEPCIR